MKRWIVVALAVVIAACLFGLRPVAPCMLQPVELRCELRDDPLGIDALRPRLSWILQCRDSSARRQRQTAYQVLVAGTRDDLDGDEGDLWDSGKVRSAQSILVPYGGRPLATGMECFWKVRVWDKDGRPSAWSKAARWSLGPLEPSHWKAKWIGLDESERVEHLEGTQWIWFPESDPAREAPVATRWFRRLIALPRDRVVAPAKLFVAADNASNVYVNGHHVGYANSFTLASGFDVADRLHGGVNVLGVCVENMGDGPNPAGLVGRLTVDFLSGERLVVATDEQWKASAKKAEGWAERGFNASDWVAAQVLGPVGMEPWKKVRAGGNRRLPARWLRKEFLVEKHVRRASVSFCGLGLSELYLNGQKVGDHVLSPALSQYSRRVFYVTHDISTRIQPGRNAVGVVLGNGRYYALRQD
jgi:alpha-L-rhamnosidase